MRLYNPTGRKTEARIAIIKDVMYYFSYETCIAAEGTFDGVHQRVRIANSWGPMTAKHFKELECKDFKIINDQDFDDLVEGRSKR
jgi:hypothetical protein